MFDIAQVLKYIDIKNYIINKTISDINFINDNNYVLISTYNTYENKLNSITDIIFYEPINKSYEKIQILEKNLIDSYVDNINNINIIRLITSNTLEEELYYRNYISNFV